MIRVFLALAFISEVEVGDIIELHSLPDLPVLVLSHHFLQEKLLDIAYLALGVSVRIIGIHSAQDAYQELLDIGSAYAILDTLLECTDLVI